MEPDPSRPNKRSRSSVACNRCKERRQKCDNAAPICTNCARANSTCGYKGGDHPAWYVESLEEKIARLEDALAASSSQGAPSVAASQASPVDGPALPPTPAPTSAHAPRTAAVPGQPFPPSHLGNALGFLSLCASAEPYYVGSSTGFSLANLVQAAVYDRLTAEEHDIPSPATIGVSPEAVRNLPSTEDRPFSCHRPRPSTKPAGMPNDELGDALISAYIEKVHTMYPFLPDGQLMQLHHGRLTLKDSEERDARTGLAKLHLVYGIGARHLQLLGTSRIPFDRSLPEGHFTAASVILNTAFELRSIDSIEILLLLALYSLHSPSGPGAWQLTGMAVRLCVELGLHRRVRAQGVAREPDPDQRRRCLFWSCLILERKVAVTLGRPFSLSDNDIDADYPMPSSVTSEGDTIASKTPLAVVAQLARLQTITSRIHALSARAGDHGLPSNNSVTAIRAELDHWLHACAAQHDTLHLEYHKATLLLLQPFLTDPTRNAQTVAECTRAAGAVCQTYKRMHQRRPAGFFLLELHDVLVAGITLIYSLWIDQCGAASFGVLKDLGACSTVLFLIAERWESAKRYRDAFEALVNATTTCLSRRSTTDVSQMQTNFNNARTPLNIGTDSQALFDTSLWGNDDSLTWKGMLGEITGAVEPGVQDWSWFTDPSFLTMQA